MDDFSDSFSEFKVSALSKSKEINSFVNSTTIGPDSTLSENETDSSLVHEKPNLNNSSKTSSLSVSTTSDSSLILNKFLAEMETERQRKVQEAVKTHLNNLVEFSNKQNSCSKQQLQVQQQILVSALQQQEQLILEALEQHNKDVQVQHQQLLQYYKDMAEKRKQHNKELEENERTKQKQSALIESIRKDQVEFRSAFQEIVNTLKSYKFSSKLREILGDIPKQVKSIPDGMEEIVNKCKAKKVTETEGRKSRELVEEIKALLVVIHQKLEAYNASIEEHTEVKNGAKPPPLSASTANQQQQLQKPSPPKPEPNIVLKSASTEIRTNPADVKAEIDKFISKSSLHMYSELQEFLQGYIKSFEELEQNSAYKQFRFNCKKAVNIPVNAISAINAHHLLDKYERLSSLMAGKAVEAGNTKVSAVEHPQGITYCTNLLAKKFVLQGDLMISSNPDAAFCYAAVVVALWHDNADFGKLLLAHFYVQCPYLVPFYPPRVVGQNDEEFYLSQGYQYVDGVIEKQDKFLKRMTGIMRLYAAIIISKPRKGQRQNPHGLEQGWRWLSSFLNLEPKPDITATMLHVFFEIAGSTFQAVYGKMFQKVVAYVCNVYVPRIQKNDSGGPVTRLEVLLQNYQKKGSFEVPHGLLPANFW